MSRNNSSFRSFSGDVGGKIIAGAAMAVGAILAQAAAEALLKWKDKKKAEYERERAAKTAQVHDLGNKAQESHMRVVRD
jgi:hypothetical protein